MTRPNPLIALALLCVSACRNFDQAVQDCIQSGHCSDGSVSTDAGALDGGTPDAGLPDAGPADAGPPDSGFALDAGPVCDGGRRTFLPAVYYDAGGTPWEVLVADFNADGNLDLAVANGGSNDVSVLLGKGDGTFQTGVSYGAGNGPISIAAGDFDRNGTLDLAVANSGSNDVTILLANGVGHGDGTFRLRGTYNAGPGTYHIVTGDFRDAGILDLAVANVGNGGTGTSMVVLLGSGDGSFQSPMSYSTGGTAPIAVTVGDFNHDGRLDLAGVNYNSGTMGVLLGRGNGTFKQPATYNVGPYPFGIVAADFRNTGVLDLAFTNSNMASQATVGVMFNDGTGAFQPQVTYPVGLGAVGIVSGDFNGDGRLDLANTNFHDNTVTVLLGLGDGGFQAAVSYAMGVNPYGIATGDFNRDGKPDLAVVDHMDNDVGVLLATGCAP